MLCMVGSKEQLSVIISSLRGHVASLLRHMVGSLGALEGAVVLGDISYKQFPTNHFCFLAHTLSSYIINATFLNPLTVVDEAYFAGNATQKQELLVELYSTELQLFKDLGSKKEGR